MRTSTSTEVRISFATAAAKSRGPQCAGVALGRNDLLGAARVNSAPHHTVRPPDEGRPRGDHEYARQPSMHGASRHESGVCNEARVFSPSATRSGFRIFTRSNRSVPCRRNGNRHRVLRNERRGRGNPRKPWTGYIVMHYSYSPLFLMAGLMHPLSAALVYCLLPDAIFVMHFDKKQARCWSGRSGFDSGRRSQ
jgi:hypothetical protein